MNDNSISYELLKKISNYIKYLSMILAGVFLVINITDILVSVFFRYFLSYSLVWTEEVARFTLIYSVMFGSVAAISYGDHVKITIVLDYLPDIISKIIKIIVHIIIVGIIAYITYLGIKYVDNAWRFQTLALGIPKAIPLMSIPIGMGLFLVQYILIEIIGINKDVITRELEMRK
ncbi:MAG: TRAP transporter small permease [Halanaerobiales bacterium]|nr:TRAP transporter small permease [Halanaerobiales bacterium]